MSNRRSARKAWLILENGKWKFQNGKPDDNGMS